MPIDLTHFTDAELEAYSNQKPETPAAPAAPGDQGGAAAFLHGVGDAATFGLQDAALTRALPSSMAEDYKSAVEATSANHPILHLIGEGVGTLFGGGVLGAGAKLAGRAVPALAKLGASLEIQKGQFFRNAVRTTVPSAAIGAVTEAAQGGDAPQVAEAAGMGAVAGPVGRVAGTVAGRVVGAIANKMQPATGVAPGWRMLADKIGEDPAVLQTAVQQFQKVTGATPTMPAILGMASRGELRSMAEANPAAAEAFNYLADNPRTAGTTMASVSKARDANFKNTMNRIGGQLLPMAPTEQAYFEQTFLPAAGINKGSPLRGVISGELKQNGITVQTADTIRQNLRALQKANPGEHYGELADVLEKWAGDPARAPKYSQALQDWHSDSNWMDGFEHGFAGKSDADVADRWTRASLSTPEGASGSEVGRVTRQERRRISGVAPNSTAPEEFSAGDAAHVAGGMLAHSAAISGFHITKFIQDKLNTLPPGAAEQIGHMFTDPNQTKNAINLLRRAGLSNKDIRSYAIATAAASGGTAARSQGQASDVVSQFGGGQ